MFHYNKRPVESIFRNEGRARKIVIIQVNIKLYACLLKSIYMDLTHMTTVMKSLMGENKRNLYGCKASKFLIKW